MGYTTYNASNPGFVGSDDSMHSFPGGVEIEWADVTDVAKYHDQNGKKFIKAGTLMARDPATGKMIPHQIADVSYTEVIGHLKSHAHSDSKTDAKSGYGVFSSGNIYENMLPEFADAWWAATGKAASAALGFNHFTYADNRS